MPPLLAVRNMSASGNFIVGDLGDVMHTKLVTSWGDVMVRKPDTLRRIFGTSKLINSTLSYTLYEAEERSDVMRVGRGVYELRHKTIIFFILIILRISVSRRLAKTYSTESRRFGVVGFLQKKSE